LTSVCAFAALTIAIQFGFSQRSAAEGASSMPSLTEVDDGRVVELRVGETVSVTLPENATTGYRWAIDRLDPGLVEVNEAKPRYPSGPVGSGGAVTFSFASTEPGSGEVSLKHWRHFEGDRSITKRFHFHIKAKP
jgi:inhibitor of cysteine peptidase